MIHENKIPDKSSNYFDNDSLIVSAGGKRVYEYISTNGKSVERYKREGCGVVSGQNLWEPRDARSQWRAY